MARKRPPLAGHDACSIAVPAILAGLAIFQALLIAGAPLGRFVWGGSHAILPAGLRIGSAIPIALYAVFAQVILDRAGVIALLPDGWSGPAAWLVGYPALGVVMNLVSRSLRERIAITPVAAALGGLSTAVALA